MTAYAPPIGTEGVKANALKKYLGVLQLDHVIKIDDAEWVLKDSRAANRAHHENVARMQGSTAPAWEEQTAEDDEMGHHVGDIYQNIQFPGAAPEAIVAGKAGVKLAAGAVAAAPSKWKKAIGAALLVAAVFAGPSAYAELMALFSAAAEIKVTWDGKEIRPGDTAAGEAEKSITTE
jgi:hypothetical protein